MPSLHNAFKHALLNRERLTGGWLLSASPAVAELMAQVGYDYLVVDLEHSPASTHDLPALLRAAGVSGSPVVVRMPSHDRVQVKLALDLGAVTLFFPMVNTVDDAVAVARACRYPPFGDRGFAPLHRGNGYGAIADYFERSNKEVCVIAQLETAQAMGAAMQIAGVPGIDGLYVGPADLAVSLGHGGNVLHPQVREIMVEVGGFCRRAGVPLGTVMPTPESVAWAYSVGYNFVAHASDLGLLATSARAAVQRIQTLAAGAPMNDPPTQIIIGADTQRGQG
ncbi:MAG: 2-dehydro-3-deoxyglucarate aldolase [Burkholderiales bacterium]|nr:2-dehydro-3-deoxyglucarate aldolase [Pseudomonadota bacterium]MCC7067261.1 2-dehydro-3-deoxyglucarate aldolase [Burkholderiales bacterium]MCZ2135968.1 2-dehydro-3-deoxyglucarate aldolase [Burkholderiales bacterium]